MSLVGSLGPSQGGAQRLPKPRLQWGAAFKALRRRFADKEDTAQVFEIMRALAWFGRRTRDVHDIWHVLTGYHRDGMGEACLVAFSYAQTRGLGWAFIAVGAALRRRGARYPYRKAIWQGYRRGRRAAWLLGEDYERLLAEPLEAARRRLNLTPPTIYDSIPAAARDPEPAAA